MITKPQYLKALKTVSEYRKQCEMEVEQVLTEFKKSNIPTIEFSPDTIIQDIICTIHHLACHAIKHVGTDEKGWARWQDPISFYSQFTLEEVMLARSVGEKKLKAILLMLKDCGVELKKS
jgi:hypothetical protein